MSDSLRPQGLQHAKPPCPSPTPGVYPHSCPLSRWCHPTISSPVIPFSSCLQSFPASGSFQMSQFFSLGGLSIGVSASTSVLPMNTQDWSPLGWTGWISLQSKGLSGVFNTTVQKHQCFVAPRQKENDSYKSESRTHVQSSTSHLSQRWKQSRWMGRDLLCDPVAKIPCFQGRGHRFNPWLRN